MSEEHVLKDWIEKKGMIGFYTKKWCTLVGSIMSIYRDDLAQRPELIIDVTEKTKITIDDMESGKFYISEENVEEVLSFRAPPDIALNWVQELRSCTFTHSTLTNDSFRRLCVLGRGNYGKVVLAEKKDTGELFAIKSVHKKRLAMADKIHTIISERNTLINATNPFVVSLHYAYQTPTKFYLVLDYVPGGELFSHMDHTGALPIEDVRLYAAETVIALHFLHTLGIIYRDLKPENILIAADGHIKLTDFGFAKDLSQSEVTKTFCGTNEYLAPEIISRISYGQSVDWWTLGILIYEMLFQTTPFYHNNTSRMFTKILTENVSFPPEADPDAASLITGLLQKRERKRFGYNEVVKHPFFAGIDWQKVYNKGYKPSFIPPIKSQRDVSNFDQEFTGEKPSDSDGSPVSTPIQHIPDFSYTASAMPPKPDIGSPIIDFLH